MISAHTLVKGSQAVLHRYVTKDKDEGTLCFQLSGNDPQLLGEAVKKAADYGADMFDLNCGCPVKKIRSRGAGSALLSEPRLLYQLITAMKNNTHLPVTIKIRVASHHTDIFNRDIANAVRDAGVDALIVHGRHWTEHYETPCHYEDIQFFVNELDLPVIGNGDVSSVETLKKMLATGCKGVMIGRAGVGQPWLIAALTAEINGDVFLPPSLKERGELFLEHVAELILLLKNEKSAVWQARTFAKYYARGCDFQDDFLRAVNVSDTLESLSQLVLSYFKDIPIAIITS